ncbi:hypothetical protein TVAG_208220 [Trichomonas vaginalis G3]|uniref:Uncharacterized protein n=1 Tax=Trichomonas vaginalis (strain ATCC PRA-98 / G3) TaxID=412133 RepID=A2FZE6_TRIV3|nr:phosphatidylinositol-3,5-bisphosphate binding [Trichomonas vaginalis G3]EAX89720.1 hypothetical protein TVAG_208220 [Trichomonas vaginalis G3]KAI5548415.1 phosphatidylinositol-3,5-bisphosphate binding [Trichomonas vaginalis G3]|eukprot:XP_001302650.1 hypothetical protein [Trichomonas vaginalis G3]
MTTLIRQVTFDQVIEKIAVTTKKGFSLYDYTNGLILYHGPGGFEHIAILSDSNIVVLSGDGSDPKFAKSSVFLWNIETNEIIKTIEHTSNVIGIFFTTDILVVVQEQYITFYNTSNFEQIFNLVNSTGTKDQISIVQTTNLSLITLPSADGKSLNVCDFHDPAYILGTINIPASEVTYAAFDRHAEFLAIVIDSGRSINLWSFDKKQFVSKYKRGTFAAKITGLVFDNMSNYFLMTSSRGTIHVFQVQRIPDPKRATIRSKYSLELPKGVDLTCCFDAAGYTINGINSSGQFNKLRVDLEKGMLDLVEEKPIDL